MILAELDRDTHAEAAGLLDAILADAGERGATHVHLEPRGDGRLRVRMRVAGRLSDAAELSIGEARMVRARIEALGLDAAALATRDGERVTLHLGMADPPAGDLAALGMPPALVRAASRLRSGLVLVAGPPKSGASATLRALLRRFDNGARNLMKLERGAPVERLRQILRQDPDAILIDNLADRESATLAVEAAGDGLLVFAAVPASDAVSAILRMRALRVAAFPLAAALQLVIAQRLVRRLCGACRRPVQAQGSVSALLGFDPGAVVHTAAGCDACGGSGYSGEIGVFEGVAVDAAMRRLIADGGDEAILARYAFLNAPNLGSAARALVRDGVTTAEEAVRVSRR